LPKHGILERGRAVTLTNRVFMSVAETSNIS
jgi:hypothetical protein